MIYVQINKITKLSYAFRHRRDFIPPSRQVSQLSHDVADVFGQPCQLVVVYVELGQVCLVIRI